MAFCNNNFLINIHIKYEKIIYRSAIKKAFYKFLISNEKPIIIKIIKIVFLKITLDNLILILVPKYCPNNAGAVIRRLTNKS